MKVKQCDLKYIGTNFSHYPMDGMPENPMSENLLLSMRFWAERHWQEPALSPEKHAPSIFMV